MDAVTLTRLASFGVSLLFTGLVVGGAGMVLLVDPWRVARYELLQPAAVRLARGALFVGTGLAVLGASIAGCLVPVSAAG